MKQTSLRKPDRNTKALRKALDSEDELAENDFYWNYTETQLRNELYVNHNRTKLSDESLDYLET